MAKMSSAYSVHKRRDRDGEPLPCDILGKEEKG